MGFFFFTKIDMECKTMPHFKLCFGIIYLSVAYVLNCLSVRGQAQLVKQSTDLSQTETTGEDNIIRLVKKETYCCLSFVFCFFF